MEVQCLPGRLSSGGKADFLKAPWLSATWAPSLGRGDRSWRLQEPDHSPRSYHKLRAVAKLQIF